MSRQATIRFRSGETITLDVAGLYARLPDGRDVPLEQDTVIVHRDVGRPVTIPVSEIKQISNQRLRFEFRAAETAVGLPTETLVVAGFVDKDDPYHILLEAIDLVEFSEVG